MEVDLYNSDFFDDGSNLIHLTAIIGDNVKLGKGNIIMPYAVIGQLGFIRGAKKAEGKVLIGDNNHIGCHAVIMTGEKGDTVIGSNNMIMHYVNIAHNVRIGNENEIGSQSVICGHTVIGHRNRIKVSCAIRNRLTIGSDNVIGMGSNVIDPIGDDGKWAGNPAIIQE